VARCHIVSRWCAVLCHLHRRHYSECVGLSNSDKRRCFHDLQRLARNGRESGSQCLRSDNGGEYKSDEFAQFCRECGIRREFTAFYSPEQNGVAERMNRTIQKQIVSMLHHSGLSDGFWAEALLTPMHIIKMSPSRPFR
jgi:transposase InsO family protein